MEFAKKLQVPFFTHSDVSRSVCMKRQKDLLPQDVTGAFGSLCFKEPDRNIFSFMDIY